MPELLAPSHVRYDLTHARHDKAHCLAPGLFRSLKRGDRHRMKLDVVYELDDGARVEFKGPEPLGSDDLRVLQGLVAMAGPQGMILTPTPRTAAGEQLRLSLEPRWDAVTANTLVVKDSFYALAREIGYSLTSGGTLRSIRESIERLWTISIIAQDSSGRRQGYRLLSGYASDTDRGKLYVALNPMLAKAVLGQLPHARINLSEVRSLKGDVARLIHQRLCGWLDPGQSARVGIDTLCGYAWPVPGQAGSSRRMRRKRIRTALSELVGLGWTVAEYARGKFAIGRPDQPEPESQLPP